jgi:hypothetical protein
LCDKLKSLRRDGVDFVHRGALAGEQVNDLPTEVEELAAILDLPPNAGPAKAQRRGGDPVHRRPVPKRLDNVDPLGKRGRENQLHIGASEPHAISA